MFVKRLPVFIFVLTGISFLLHSCNDAHTLFRKISPGHSGIYFNNVVVENDSINPLDMEYLYNGGGIAVGDFNNDGLADLYFTASTVSNKLYMNKGNLSFSDETEGAGVSGDGIWSNAASVVDINNDGWKDIYVCATVKKDPQKRKNLLYVNQGLDENGRPVFKEMAESYGLADTAFSVHAAFFDYDNDGDLDMYLANTKLAGRSGSQFFNNNFGDTLTDDYDKLYRNDWSETLHHPFFTDVTKASGIGAHGFALGLAVADINRDGWKDIYVANDFFSNDELYINNKDGSFINKRDLYFKHTSQNAMGNDIADINNDGLADMITVDMNPEDNFRKKKNMGSANYFVYQNMVNGIYALQYVRNTLQLNRGPSIGDNDTIGEPVFSDIGFYAGVAETDWSWNPSLADFDNDGYRDILITNGYPRDVTDHDFAAYRQRVDPHTTKQQLIDQMPRIKVTNYAFRNKGNLKFENVTSQWGINEPSFSNGAVYVDLDNDGDLDYVVNNVNEKAFLYENTLNNKKKFSANYLQIKFNGGEKNKNGLGAIAEIYYDGQSQVYENSPYRGYLSTVNDIACFGLGKNDMIDSLIIEWTGGRRQVLQKIAANQLIEVNINDAMDHSSPRSAIAQHNLFTDITKEAGVQYRHAEVDFVDFNYQRLLPHKFSQYGPPLAAGDLDGNGLDDIVIGGNTVMEPAMLMQQPDGKFIEKILPAVTVPDARKPETMGIVVFDADNDDDMDIYMASGSSEFMPGTKNYQDRLYVNQGKGNLVINEAALPINYASKSCVKAADYDHDGDLDLFIGGRLLPGKYPVAVNSFILRNDSGSGVVKFTDATAEVAEGLIDIGLVCDALWTDFDNDGWEDLIVVGEWMPLRFFKNDNGKLKALPFASGAMGEAGLWNSLVAGDFDNDGDMDYITSNLGDNSYYRADVQNPVRIYGKDFDRNEGYDIITTMYLKDEKGGLKEFPAQNRDEIIEQIPGLKKRFFTYKSFGSATVHDIFTKEELQDALTLEARNIKSCYVKNLGNGKFECYPLPLEAQLAPLYGMVADDFNSDGNLDVAINGNDFGTEVATGRYDALNGLVLLGDGKGNFRSQTILESGIFIPGDGKALIRLKQAEGHYMLAASQNQSALKLFRLKKDSRLVALERDEIYALIHLQDGKTRREEFQYGSSFLSQSARFITINDTVESVEIFSRNGPSRLIK